MHHSRLLAMAQHILKSVKDKTLTSEQRREISIELAGILLMESKRCQTRAEKKVQAQLARMMKDGSGKAFTTSMTDQCFRSKNAKRVADQLIYLLEQYGIPRYLPFFKKAELRAFYLLGNSLAKALVPLIRMIMRQETRSLILPGETKALSKHMHLRSKEGVRINLNHLGEAILGEIEAENRLAIYLADLANPDVECISIKISTLYSQINLIGWEDTLHVLCSRLKILYRAAKEHLYLLPNGKKNYKFINLDMEEYRDLQLTVELFRRVLDESEFFDLSAGVALQSYVPDTFLMQQELTAWAMQRVARGGAPVKIRIVKGANLAMEKVEASLHGWPQAPYLVKTDADANFKRMVLYGSLPERAKAVHLGIGSHNLFDIAYALLLRSENNIEPYVEFEMLEGMADHLRRVVQTISGKILLYCPAATEDEFQNAIAYLVRRLDENTAPENFLSHAFNMVPGSEEWNTQAKLFSEACYATGTTSYQPRRHQNRFFMPARKEYSAPFENEPDTDWSLLQNRKWAESLLLEMRKKQFEIIPIVIDEKEVSTGVELASGVDPSFLSKELYRYALGNHAHLDVMMDAAVGGFKDWSARPFKERLLILREVAHQLRCHRGELIEVMVADTGKTIYEADVEISEAIDFAEYYPRNAEQIHFFEDIQFSAKGPVLVASPWNFPCSIPTGGIIAALAAGNSVIFKPAPEAVLVGWVLVNIFWKSGISKKTLQFFNCHEDPIGSLLIQDARLAAVILTGSTNTAKYFMKLRPSLDLIAETGGKNAIIVSAMADRDLAIKDIVQSAFGHAGQKCSACSLVILEAEVYDDPLFKLKLRDAAASLKVGSPWDLSTRVNPLIHAPNDLLMHGLTALEPSEAWLLKPKADANNPNLWSPGIKIGVQPYSFMHQTELFGPVLGVMRADNLKHAIELANATPYGLTSGIHTLDQREKEYWKIHIEAGNRYINRGITGAIVQRQPFGGMKESNFGPGAKAGGPNYIMQLMHAEQKGLPRYKEFPTGDAAVLNQMIEAYPLDIEVKKLWQASIGSYAFFWNHYFSKSHDPSQVLGQDNLLYYSAQQQVLRLQDGDSDFDAMRAIAAALICGAPLEVSFSGDQKMAMLEAMMTPEKSGQFQKLTITIETEDDLIDRMKAGKINRLRLFSHPGSLLQNALAETACHRVISPVFANGRIELLRCLCEISLSSDYHRYGNLGLREQGKE